MLNLNSYRDIKYQADPRRSSDVYTKNRGQGKTERGIFEIVGALRSSFFPFFRSTFFAEFANSEFTCTERPINPAKYRNYPPFLRELPASILVFLLSVDRTFIVPSRLLSRRFSASFCSNISPRKGERTLFGNFFPAG